MLCQALILIVDLCQILVYNVTNVAWAAALPPKGGDAMFCLTFYELLSVLIAVYALHSAKKRDRKKNKNNRPRDKR